MTQSSPKSYGFFLVPRFAMMAFTSAIEPLRAANLRGGASNPRLLEVIAVMEENLEQPLSGAELARLSGMSKRQLERLFRRYLGRPPMQYYMELRLQRAHHLLTNSAMSVLEVGVACGFTSASHFAKRYRDLYHQTPRSTRLRPCGG